MCSAQTARKQGFTLSELLIVLALVAILAAVAIPSIIAVRKNLKMAQLDSYAQELSLAVQNTLTGMKADGTLESLTDGSVPGIKSDGELYYLWDSSSAAEVLLPAGSLEGRELDGHWLLRFNPATATVREAYYCERAFSYDEAVGLREDASARRREEIGYYCGADAGAAVVKQLPPPEITVQNENVLSLEITVAREYAEHTKLSVTVENAVDPEQAVIFEAGDFRLPKPSLIDGTTTLILDSLKEADQFRNIFKGEGTSFLITPGADLKITARLQSTGGSSVEDEGVILMESSSQVQLNSLFASRQEGLVRISCARHLQNLDVNSAAVTESVTAAQQVRAINWRTAQEQLGEELEFSPIRNGALMSYDGDGFPIQNLVVNSSGPAGLFETFGPESADAGLGSLREITIADPAVTGEGDAGALAGQLQNTDVQGCRVYSSDTQAASTCFVRGKNRVGGLAGSVSGTAAADCQVGLPLIQAQDARSLGGFAGTADSQSSFQSSYAAVDQLAGSTEYAAMFLADSQGAQIENCYSVGNLSAVSGKIPSGFLNGTARVSNCYCAVTYYAQDGAQRGTEAYGFYAGESENCAYLAQGTGASVPERENPDPALALSYSQLEEWPGETLAAFVPRGLDESASHPYHAELLGKAYPFAALYRGAEKSQGFLEHFGSWPMKTQRPALDRAAAYFEDYGDSSMGIYAVTAAGQRADTLDKKDSAHIRMARYGILLADDNLAQITGIRARAGTESLELQPAALEETGKRRVILEGEEYSFFPFTAAAQQRLGLLGQRSRGIELEIDYGDAREAFAVNMLFGASITGKADAPALGTRDGCPYQVRTQAQLSALSTSMPFTIGTSCYLQTHSIMVDDTFESIRFYRTDALFDGQGQYSISGLSVPLFEVVDARVSNVTIEDSSLNCSWEKAGIFTGEISVKGSVKNCKVLNCSLNGTGSSAGFAGKNSGMIENCLVAALKEESDGYIAAGPGGTGAGFVLENTQSGVISGCSFTGVVSGDFAAGFLGVNQGTVTRCYSNGLLGDYRTRENAAFALENSSGSIENCYTTARLRLGSGDSQGKASAFILRVQGDGTVENCYSASMLDEVLRGKENFRFAPSQAAGISNCYAWDSGSFEGELPQGVKGCSYGEMASGLCDWLNPDENNREWAYQGAKTYPHTLEGEYPLPMLAGQDFYGDWPQEPSVPQAPQGKNLLGVFHYNWVHTASGYEFTITSAAALDCVQGKPDIQAGIYPQPLGLSGVKFYLEKEPAWPKEGFGVFWTQGFPFTEKGSKKGFFFTSGSGTTTLMDSALGGALNPQPGSYYFLPLVPASQEGISISFAHSSGTNQHDWEFTFSYSAAENAFDTAAAN